MARRFEAKQTTIIRELQSLMQKLGATSLRIDTPNLLDESDVLARITFDRHAKRYISVCDRWDHWVDNLRAAQLAIEYTWRIAEGYGVSINENAILDRIFAALEAPLDPNILLLGDGNGEWWEVLGVAPDASGAAIVNAYKALAKVHHPDMGGRKEDFIRLKTAYEKGISEKEN
jgi:hypothetical protein